MEIDFWNFLNPVDESLSSNKFSLCVSWRVVTMKATNAEIKFNLHCISLKNTENRRYEVAILFNFLFSISKNVSVEETVKKKKS